jgi:hypothetical protein
MPQDQMLGAGKLFFTLFPTGQFTNAGAMEYFGNTPELSTTQDDTVLDHYDADNGIRKKDISIVTSRDRTVSFTTDNISAENLARWFSGEQQTIAQTAATELSQTETVKRGGYIQLGVSDALPAGARSVTNVEITNGGTAVAAAGNYTVDLDRGIIFILAEAADIEDKDSITVTYDRALVTREVVVSADKSLFGRLYFQADNGYGANRDYTWPFVKLTPTGDFNIKTDNDWASLSFECEVLSPPTGPSVIIG